ncbi:MAG TPA: LptA/OstA family protein [Caulobacteraceae bacterium]|nr:LptA/OstA family protein [Caulobacteraceae bacterium]
MKRSAKISALAALALAGVVLAAGDARAQLASGKGPIDVTADQLEMIDAQHLAIWRGNVEALQNGNRLVSDVLNVYFSGKSAAGSAPAAPAAPASAGGVGADWGDVERLVAEGHVFYVSQDQTARGEHAVYEAAPDMITMTGDVVLVQGKNVTKGDKLVIDVKTNHAVLTSTAQGRNHPDRVRGVFYNANSAAPASPAAPAKP